MHSSDCLLPTFFGRTHSEITYLSLIVLNHKKMAFELQTIYIPISKYGFRGCQFDIFPFINHNLCGSGTCPHKYTPAHTYTTHLTSSGFHLNLFTLILFLVSCNIGSVRWGLVISGIIERLMPLQKPGTLTGLSVFRAHFLPNGREPDMMTARWNRESHSTFWGRWGWHRRS